jgi:hypothetical protein
MCIINISKRKEYNLMCAKELKKSTTSAMPQKPILAKLESLSPYRGMKKIEGTIAGVWSKRTV